MRTANRVHSPWRIRIAAIFLPVVLLGSFPGRADGATNGWRNIILQIRSQFPAVRHIGTRELARRMEGGRTNRTVLLDVREPGEFAVSHIRGARRAVNRKEALAALSSTPKDTPIVAYCSVGYRSARLAMALHAAGYTNIVNLRGSIFQWANEGRPLYRGRKEVKTVHPYDLVWGQLLERDLRATPGKD